MAKKKANGKTAKKATITKPRQKRLPGTEDNAIQELEEKALEYVEVRDDRMALSKKEGPLKAELLALMKRHRKDTYSCNGIEITRVVEEETVKVKVKVKGEEPLDDSEESDNEVTVQ